MSKPLEDVALVGQQTPQSGSLLWILPHAVTLAALVAGMAAIMFSISGEIHRAIGCVVLAAALDGCDGRLARMAGTSSKFGAELDSLSDVVCFGAAPAIILAQWGLAEFGWQGWAISMTVTLAAALRLARFNVMVLDPNKPVWSSAFFQGVPAPAGAFLVLLPIYIAFSEIASTPFVQQFALFWCPGVALLMVSTLPTFSGKLVSKVMSRTWVLLLAITALHTFVFMQWGIWMMLVCASSVYLLTFPFSRWRHAVLVSRG